VQAEAVKFLYIGLCFMIALLSRLCCRSKADWAALAFGMAATLAADYFLVLYDNQQAGVPVFCLAHAAYIVRAQIHLRSNKTVARKILVHFAATVFLAAPLFLFWDFLLAASVTYAALFMQNITVTTLFFVKCKGVPLANRLLTLAGVILFFLCDINVLLYNLPRFIHFPENIADAAFALIWFFYAPSQGLLSVSAVDATSINLKRNGRGHNSLLPCKNKENAGGPQCVKK
jgi:hypothetical protein